MSERTRLISTDNIKRRGGNMMKKAITILALLVISILFSSVLALSATAAGDKLKIKDLVVEIDGDKDGSANEGGGSFKVIPGSTVDIDVEVESLYSSSDDIEIEGVEVAILIEEIDDGDDIDEESDDFDLKPGKDKTVKFSFDLPYQLDHDETFTMNVLAEGRDENGTMHSVSLDIDVEIDKEKHELIFKEAKLSPTEVECQRQSSLSVEMLNIGEEEEEDVVFTITSDKLDVRYSNTFDMSEDIDDDENEFDYSLLIDAADVKAGTYPIFVEADYNDDRDTLQKTLNLVVKECESTTTTKEPEKKVTETVTVVEKVVETKPETIEVVTSAPSPVVNPALYPTVAQPPVVISQPKSWWTDNKWVVLFIIADILLIVIAIAIIMAVMKRR